VTLNANLVTDEQAVTASGECYVTLFQRTDELPLQPIFAGHYFEDFERVGGVWRFSKRLIRHAAVRDLSTHLGRNRSSKRRCRLTGSWSAAVEWGMAMMVERYSTHELGLFRRGGARAEPPRRGKRRGAGGQSISSASD
jgi:hypothetical protein